MSAKNLQDDIRKLLDQCGLSVRQGAEIVFTEEDDDGDINRPEFEKYYQKFKKQLSRNTTPISRLEYIKNMLLRRREIKNSSLVYLSYVESPCISGNDLRFMREISRELDRELTERYEDVEE